MVEHAQHLNTVAGLSEQEANGLPSATAFHDVEPDPTLSNVNRGLALLRSYHPDVIIAIGGGSPMDAAKVMWLMYEHPEIEFAGLAMRFMDIRKRVYE
jgi:acetaldehyde dehydrogenase / alcohol dehydrogenase